MSNIHANIKKRRLEIGMSQEDLAERVGYNSHTTIAKIESGTRNFPQSKLMLFAEALKVDPVWLLGYDSVAAEDAEIVGNLAARAKDRLPLPPDIAALNVLLRDAGEIIERTEDGYYTASTGFLSEDDLDFLKTSAVNALKAAVDMLARRRTLELREMLNGKRGAE